MSLFSGQGTGTASAAQLGGKPSGATPIKAFEIRNTHATAALYVGGSSTLTTANGHQVPAGTVLSLRDVELDLHEIYVIGDTATYTWLGVE